MGIDTKTYFSNSIPGAMNIGADNDLYKVDTSPKLAVGTKMERQDGNVFRYVHIGSACAAGAVVAPDLNAGSRAYSANVMVAPSSVFQQDSEITGVYPGAVGSRFMVAVIGTQAADAFAGGYIAISSGTGLGYTYRVKGNRASSGTATVIELYDPIKVAIDATADVAIGGCKYQALMEAIAGSTQNGMPVGILVSAVASTSSYAWICTKGMIAVKQSGTPVTGNPAALSLTDQGHICAWGEDVGAATTGNLLLAQINVPIVGITALAGATSGHCIVNVSLE
jgi:hypothetical protein